MKKVKRSVGYIKSNIVKETTDVTPSYDLLRVSAGATDPGLGQPFAKETNYKLLING